MRPDQSVIISFDYGQDGLTPLLELSAKLEAVLKKEMAGELDGHEVAMDDSDGRLFMYGHDAEILFKAVRPTLRKVPWMHGATATMRFGRADEEAPEITVDI